MLLASVMEICPVCAHAAEVSGPARTIITCAACHAPFVPEGSTSVQLAARPRASAAAEVEELDLPETFRARYRLECRLGAGTMGTVYRARLREDGSLVAVKFLTRVDHPDALARFLREARLLLTVRHPNVVAVREVQEVGGHPYFVTEYVAGGTLRERLDRDGPMDPLTAVGLACDALAGLQACHDLGIVHRDVKPANLLLDGDGALKIADLGVARGIGEAPLTEVGALLGSPTYMAPEQTRGLPAGPPADVYALGLVLYEALCGSPPFRAETLPALLTAQQSTPPRPLRERAPHVPAKIAAVVHHALAKAPGDRPTSARAMAATLKQAVGAVLPEAEVTDVEGLSGILRDAVERKASGAARPSAPPEGARPARGDGLWRALSALTFVGLMMLAAVSRQGAAPESAGPAASPDSAGPADAPPALDAGERDEVRALMGALEAAPIELAPWGGDGVEVDCPMVVVCADHVERVRVQVAAGCRVIAVNGVLLTGAVTSLSTPRGEGFTVVTPVAHHLHDGVNWVRLRSERGGEVSGTAFPDRQPCAPALPERALPPPEVPAYNRVNVALYGRVPADTAAGRAAVAREYPDAGPDAQAALVRVASVDDDMVDNIAGAVVQVTDDPVWTDREKLAIERRGVDVLQASIARAPLRWDAWNDLGYLMRKCGQPAAARAALVRALTLWPSSYWSWRELGFLDRREWKQRDRRFEDRRRDAVRHLRYARRFYLASGLSIFWMIPEIDSALRGLGDR